MENDRLIVTLFTVKKIAVVVLRFKKSISNFPYLFSSVFFQQMDNCTDLKSKKKEVHPYSQWHHKRSLSRASSREYYGGTIFAHGLMNLSHSLQRRFLQLGHEALTSELGSLVSVGTKAHWSGCVFEVNTL